MGYLLKTDECYSIKVIAVRVQELLYLVAIKLNVNANRFLESYFLGSNFHKSGTKLLLDSNSFSANVQCTVQCSQFTT